MRRIYLMTLYKAQPCVQAKPYILLHCVRNCKEYRLTASYGNVNFTDFWISTVDALKNLEGIYSGQHFSLLNDEEQNEVCDEFWNLQSINSVVVSLIKINSEINLEMSAVEKIIMDQVTADQEVKGKIFRTMDNADMILLMRCENANVLDKLLGQVIATKFNGEDIFYSYYSVKGSLKKIASSGDYIINELQNVEEQKLIPNRVGENTWCKKILKKLGEKIDENKKIKNKKWVSYYSALYQIVNLLGQYDQEIKFKDMFYIFYPPIYLFIQQLEEGQKAIKDYATMQKIEKSVSKFIDSMEVLIHHMGMSCPNILDVQGRNGLPYDVSIKLCMLYLSSLHMIKQILNDDENCDYQFCLSPLAYSRPVTDIFEFGLEPSSRLIRIQIAKHQMLSPRALLAILAHEGSHYIGEFRNREKRAECFTTIASIILLEKLLPKYEVIRLIKDYKVQEDYQKILLNNWDERKRKFFEYFKRQLNAQLKSKNKNKRYKYHSDELYMEMCEIIRDLLYDPEDNLQSCMNMVSDDLKNCFAMKDIKTEFILAYEAEEEGFHKRLMMILGSGGISYEIEKMESNFKEIVADIGAILLLDLEPREYLEAYLISESYMLDPSMIDETLINRVAIVKMVMAQNKKWDDNWEKMSQEELGNNEFLWNLKKMVEEYVLQYENKKDAEEGIYDKEDYSNGQLNIFMIRSVIEEEETYLKTCYEDLKEHINREEAKKPKELLRNVYKHFKLYKENEEPSYKEFFVDLEKLVKAYKDAVVKTWNLRKRD